MVNEACVITPLPQLILQEVFFPDGYGDSPDLLPGGLLIRRVTPQIRRYLLEAAKAKCSQAALHTVVDLVLKSESIAILPVPKPKPVSESLISGALFQPVADQILRRIFDCLRIFGDVPQPFEHFCWFSACGNAAAPQWDTIEPANRDWARPYDVVPNVDEIRVAVWSVNALTLAKPHWQKLSMICQIDPLVKAYANPEKIKEYINAGNAEIKRGAEEDASLVGNEVGPNLLIGAEPIAINIPSKRHAKRFLYGFVRAFKSEIAQLEEQLYLERPGARFPRAFQIFISAFKLEEPYRFVTFATCLEALFSTDSSELTFQLATRLPWLLEPSDPNKRCELFQKIKKLYGLRSKIVHGDTYKHELLYEGEDDITDLIRQAFRAILIDDKTFELFTNAKKDTCDEYLKRLSLGAV